jgi:hypothetical protein
MQFSDQAKSETIQFRVTPAERAFLAAKAEELETTVAGVLRLALDTWLATQSAGGSGSRDSGSRATPSGVKAKVKALSNRSPSRNQGRTQ